LGNTERPKGMARVENVGPGLLGLLTLFASLVRGTRQHRQAVIYPYFRKPAYVYIYIFWLVVWNMFYVSIELLGIIIPTDELIFFRGVGIPPTSILSI
jgi:hypothetical protein